MVLYVINGHFARLALLIPRWDRKRVSLWPWYHSISWCHLFRDWCWPGFSRGYQRRVLPRLRNAAAARRPRYRYEKMVYERDMISFTAVSRVVASLFKAAGVLFMLRLKECGTKRAPKVMGWWISLSLPWAVWALSKWCLYIAHDEQELKSWYYLWRTWPSLWQFRNYLSDGIVQSLGIFQLLLHQQCYYGTKLWKSIHLRIVQWARRAKDCKVHPI